MAYESGWEAAMKNYRHLPRSVALATSLLLAGCGLAETGAATAAGGATAAEQARQAKETEAKVRAQIDAAMKSGADHRAAAETEAP
jgi:hypothetical protein